MQLERLLQCQGFGTRKACRALIRAGRVQVSGQMCDDPWADVATEDLLFTVDGVEWPFRQPSTVILHKPAGYECSRKPLHHPSVLSLLPAPLRERQVQPVGRLDEDTTGLLVLTDDGQLNHVLASGKRKIPKIYVLTPAHPMTQLQLEALCAGVVLHDDPMPVAAAAAEVLANGDVRLTVTGGKYHQVKRMVAAVGNRVERLHREAIGAFELPVDLLPGTWRWATEQEVVALQGAV